MKDLLQEAPLAVRAVRAWLPKSSVSRQKRQDVKSPNYFSFLTSIVDRSQMPAQRPAALTPKINTVPLDWCATCMPLPINRPTGFNEAVLAAYTVGSVLCCTYVKWIQLAFDRTH